MKKHLVRIASLILIGTMIASVYGCTSSTPTSTTLTPVVTTKPDTTTVVTTLATTGPAKPVTISFAHNYTSTSQQWPLANERLNAFKAKYPNITITLDEAPGEQLKTKVQVELAGGTLADVLAFWAQPALLAPMTDAKAILDIQTYFKASATLKATSWAQEPLDGIKSADGVNYCIPMTMSAGYIIYNKEIFAKYNLTPPTTFEEWKTVATVLNKNNIVPFASASNNSIPGHFVWSQIAMQYDKGIADSFNIGTTCNINTPAFLKASQYISEMKQAGIFPSDTMAAGQWAAIYALYGSGKAAMTQIFPFSFGSIKESGIDKVSGIMDFPKFPGSTVDNKSFTIGNPQDGFLFNSKSWTDPAKKDAMIKFGDWLLDDESFKLVAKNGALVAKTTVDLSSVTIDPFFKMCFDFTKNMTLQPFTKGRLKNQAMVADFQNEMDKLFSGADSPSDFIANVQKSLDKNK